MSNRVDPSETRPIRRPCTCEGKPHGEDTADVRVKLGYGEIAIYRQAGWTRSGGNVYSAEDSIAALVALGTVRWNLVMPDGKPRPITSAEVELLDEDTVWWLYEALKPAVARNPLPNGSGALSPSGQPESAGSTLTTPEPTTSTTS